VADVYLDNLTDLVPLLVNGLSGGRPC